MDPPPVQYATTSDGYNIAYSVIGQGPPIVIMPRPINHLVLRWQVDSILEQLADLYTVVQYDSRGQGLSTRNLPAEHEASDYVRDLEAVVDRLRLPKFILCGSAFFAHTAVHYAVAHPDRVHTLVLVNTRLSAGSQFSSQLESLARSDWPMFLQVAARSTPALALSTDFALEYAHRSVNKEDWIARVNAFAGQELQGILKDVRVPTLVIASPRSLFSGEEQGREIAALIPNSRLLLPPDDDFGDTIYDILRDLRTTLDIDSSATSNHPALDLSPRELEVLRLICAGKSNQQIADELVLSVNTVARHVANILSKAHVANRTEAAAYARDNGLL